MRSHIAYFFWILTTSMHGSRPMRLFFKAVRSNLTPHSDAREAACHFQQSRRWV